MASFPSYVNRKFTAEAIQPNPITTMEEFKAQYFGNNIPEGSDRVLHALAKRLMDMRDKGEDMARVELAQMLRGGNEETREVHKAIRNALGINDSNPMDYSKENYAQFVNQLMGVVNKEEL